MDEETRSIIDTILRHDDFDWNSNLNMVGN